MAHPHGLAASIRGVPFAGIYGIVDRAVCGDDPFRVLDGMLAAGVRVVQYRAKAGVNRDIVRALHARTQSARALLFVNDDLEAALLADGLHVGQEDLADLEAGAFVRLERRVLGVSCGVADEAIAAVGLGAHYVGVGPYAATASKGDAGDAIGAAGVTAVVRAVGVPVVAIGGIDARNAVAVRAAGAAMGAVISAIGAAADPETAARELVRAWGPV